MALNPLVGTQSHQVGWGQDPDVSDRPNLENFD